MRVVSEIKYETIVESDVHESNAYAFNCDDRINFLCKI